jgi:hypothetical protein
MLRQVLFFAILSLFCTGVRAQFTVKIVLDAIPPKHPDDAVFLSGEYNQWTPNDPAYQFVKDATGKFVLTSENVPGDTYEVKVTRGSKETIECGGDGSSIPNRKITITSDTTFHFTIAGWSDDFPKQKVVPSKAR